MAKISANYEVVYIIDPAQGEEAIAATVAKFQTLAEQNGSDVVVDEWGKRRLAYAIDYKTEGYYVLMSFTSGPEFPKELDRILGITEGIVTSFSLAVDRDFKSQSGEKETDFIDVVAWRSTAEFVAKYFTKGRMAVVEGRLQIRDWKDREGNNRRSAEVVADNVYFGDSKRDGAPAGGSFSAPPAYGAPTGGYTAPVGGSSEFAEIDEEDGDLPF